jgi:Tfp pilus assembly protein PilV
MNLPAVSRSRKWNAAAESPIARAAWLAKSLASKILTQPTMNTSADQVWSSCHAWNMARTNDSGKSGSALPTAAGMSFIVESSTSCGSPPRSHRLREL